LNNVFLTTSLHGVGYTPRVKLGILIPATNLKHTTYESEPPTGGPALRVVRKLASHYRMYVSQTFLDHVPSSSPSIRQQRKPEHNSISSNLEIGSARNPSSLIPRQTYAVRAQLNTTNSNLDQTRSHELNQDVRTWQIIFRYWIDQEGGVHAVLVQNLHEILMKVLVYSESGDLFWLGMQRCEAGPLVALRFSCTLSEHCPKVELLIFTVIFITILCPLHISISGPFLFPGMPSSCIPRSSARVEDGRCCRLT